MNIDCIRCKGRGFCGRSSCPHILKAAAMFKVRLPEKDFQGSSPAPFIGRSGYPSVNVGILSTEDKPDAWLHDAPKHWAEHGFGIQDIVGYRSSLINSRQKADVRGRSMDIAREIGMASRPVEVEISLEDRPRFSFSADSVMAPHGPTGVLRKADITSNPKIDPKVERVVDDNDLRAGKAIEYLYDRGFDETFLSKLLSVGTLGLKPERRLVPTRWSITATDDMIGKKLIDGIRDKNTIDDYQAFFGSYLGNYYIVMLMPDVWGYELFETYMPKASWNVTDEINFSTDYEDFKGRSSYAENCAGGYYTSRLAVAEHLSGIGRQAKVVVIRVITGEYSVPLGVWVTREATRKAMKERALLFDSRELMLAYAKSLCKKKFGIDLSVMTVKSILLRQDRTQKKLTSF